MNWSTTSDIITSVTEILIVSGGIIGTIWGLLTWAAKKEFAKVEDMDRIKEELDERINGLDSKINDLSNDIGSIKITLTYQPTMKDMERFTDRLASIATEVGKIGATSAAQSDMLRSIDQRLIDKNR